MIPSKSAKQMAEIVELLLKDHHLRNNMALVGKKRMGTSGGSRALAKLILNSVRDT